MQQTNLKKVDYQMNFQNASKEGFTWYTVDEKDFVLDGLYWYTPGKAFRRLPEDVHISEGVDYLAWHTAGVMLRFCSDAQEIRIDAKIKSSGDVCDHITRDCVAGFDTYVGSHTAKFYAKNTRFDPFLDEYTVPIFKVEEKKMREFTIHFPLFGHPEKVLIGLPEGTKILPPSPWRDPRPVVVYGTSIQQGGCASRPGMCHTNIMSRLLDRPFLNFGFSGSGRCEAEMAQILAEIEDPAMYVIDCDANTGPEKLRERLPVFVDILREKHPETPILLVSQTLFAAEMLGSQEYTGRRLAFTTIHRGELARRRQMGDNNIFFLDGTTLYGPDPSECTVDGAHATDLGFYNIAHRMAPEIEHILAR